MKVKLQNSAIIGIGLILLGIPAVSCIRKYGNLELKNPAYKGDLCFIVDRSVLAKSKDFLMGMRIQYGKSVVVEGLHVGYHAVKASFPGASKSSNLAANLGSGDNCVFNTGTYAEYEVYVDSNKINLLLVNVKDILKR